MCFTSQVSRSLLIAGLSRPRTTARKDSRSCCCLHLKHRTLSCQLLSLSTRRRHDDQLRSPVQMFPMTRCDLDSQSCDLDELAQQLDSLWQRLTLQDLRGDPVLHLTAALQYKLQVEGAPARLFPVKHVAHKLHLTQTRMMRK